MRTTQQRAPVGAVPGARLVLAYDQRRKSRQRARLDSGEEIALLLPRGTVLRAGDRLATDDGLVVAVEAAAEPLSSVATNDALLLARAAYHLGNRHVPLQIEPGRLRYRHDHVLDDLVRSLGLTVTADEGPFEPEGGAYHSHRRGPADHPAGHEHPPDHPHAHGQDHDQDHDDGG
jgi:urease accessory protein